MSFDTDPSIYTKHYTLWGKIMKLEIIKYIFINIMQILAIVIGYKGINKKHYLIYLYLSMFCHLPFYMHEDYNFPINITEWLLIIAYLVMLWVSIFKHNKKSEKK